MVFSNHVNDKDKKSAEITTEGDKKRADKKKLKIRGGTTVVEVV